MKKYLLSIFIVLVITNSLCQAQTFLWGMTSEGGVYGGGAIFNINIEDSSFSTIYSFVDSLGFSPLDALLYANDGELYGTTQHGGNDDDGVLFSFNLNNNIYTEIYAFDGLNGEEPYSNLIQANSGKFYGNTISGGTYDNYGVLFSFDPITKNYTVLHDFMGSDGQYPTGPAMQASNGKIYGMASGGGSNSREQGDIYSFNPKDSIFEDLHDFNDTTGSTPDGYLLQVSNGLFYGVTRYGGSNNWGVLFSFDTSTNKYSELFDFGTATGISPFGSLIQANNSKLYGMTQGGGAHGWGTIFSFDITNNNFQDVHDFDSINGSEPNGNLFQATNGNLYGTTWSGGLNDQGVVFSFDISDSSFHKLFNLASYDCSYPYGSLIELPTTGINQLSVNNNQLSIFPNPTSGQFTIKPNGNQNGYTVEIYNVMGERIYESVLSNLQNIISLSSQPDGMYFVYLKSDENIEVGKVMLTK